MMNQHVGAKLAWHRWILAWACLLGSSSAFSAARGVGEIGLTVGRLEIVLPFYTNVLRFELVEDVPMAAAQATLLTGVAEASARQVVLRLGDERITLTEWRTPTGRAIPLDSRSYDHWFQHIAIVVRDMEEAYGWLRQNRVRHVSTAPQTLPDWNSAAGGIKAFYFRDPEDHVLEIIWFPPGKGDTRWQRPSERLFLGIDHTAIVVSDTERSLSFYRDRLGLRVAGGSENFGVEQEHLNLVFGARLRITALRAPTGPGIELLEYLTPPGGRPLWPEAGVHDLVFWTTTVEVDAWQRGAGERVLAASADGTDLLLRDPDGHALWLRGGGEFPEQVIGSAAP